MSSQVREAWQLYVTFGVLVGAGVSAFYVPLTVLAIRWFDDRRGMAAAIVSAGNGLGIMALSPLSRWLINELDWRIAFVVLGDLAWLIVIPCALFLKPSPTAAPAPGWASGRAGLAAPVGQILVSWPIWAIALTHFACCAAHSGPIFHLVSHAIDQGVGSMAAASILGVSGLSSIVGRVGSGIVADRLGGQAHSHRHARCAGSPDPPVPRRHDRGLALGALTGLRGGVRRGDAALCGLTREYFGEAIMGTAYGWVFFISCMGMGLGSFLGGAIHDALGSYQGLFVGSFAVGAMAVVVAATLRPPALPHFRTAKVRAA